ncbi:MAG: hypothetical protein A2Y00_02005 [Omnitrophica WOR_2 bacterium GWF2_43_52]|nr:MAG: hypothetical protein A2Y00_02005 [Omnitrophica WOR_2 bacterium GWF2_43_52]OGX53191.1 MAG: hypothetical protein A2460_03200 [Omnitrophica WOR_2 bacterium RIFOXYC2_FULL_43_9]HAH20593.1 hypothetical protein [Candidatus Omnitrophota bacterium]HBG63512.1 hypothetical protein [Candidatus Omnitrophota bacterium]HCD39197.1 hypothetical protein [Candidatus Omnitrophota bacterium]
MAYLTVFERKLDQLFLDRTFNLRCMLGLKKRGPKPQITRKKINKAIEDLQGLASRILASGLAKKEFEENAGPKKGRKITGRGWKPQKEKFDRWFNKEFPNQDELVYVFWNKDKCLYVGRTGNGGSRPSSHFNRKDIPKITRIDIYPAKSKVYTPKLECLAVHHFEPRANAYKPSEKKWTKKCPLCAIHKQITAELRKIFRMK